MDNDPAMFWACVWGGGIAVIGWAIVMAVMWRGRQKEMTVIMPPDGFKRGDIIECDFCDGRNEFIVTQVRVTSLVLSKNRWWRRLLLRVKMWRGKQ